MGTSIYGLIDPRTGCLRYVGKSINPAKRLSVHLADSERNLKCQWIRGLKKLGLKPLLEVLEGVPDDQADDVERFWIASLRSVGAQLLNMTDGGDGVTWTAELRRAHSRHRHSEETRARQSAAQLGVPKSPEHRAKMSKFPKGYRHPRVVELAAAEKRRGMKRSEEFKQKQRANAIAQWANRRAQ